MKLTDHPGIKTKGGHLITNMLHPDCAACLAQAELAVVTMRISGSDGASAVVDSDTDTDRHGAKVKRDQTYYGQDYWDRSI